MVDQPLLTPDETASPKSPAPTTAKTSPSSWDAFVRRTVLLAVIYALPACLATAALTLGPQSANPDSWWHLATGRWIAQHHAIPRTDPFSAFGLGKPWWAYGWLFDLAVYGTYRSLGLIGPAICVVLLAAGTGIVLFQAIQKRTRVVAASVGLTALGILVLTHFYTPMPVLISAFLFIIEMDILFSAVTSERGEYSRRQVWLLPLLFALWANIHVEFVYGFAALVLAALTQNRALIQGPRGLQVVTTSNDNRSNLWLVSGVSFIATLLNPYGWRIYEVIVGLARDHAPFDFVLELRAPDFRIPSDYILILLMLSAAFVLGRVHFRGDLFAGLLLASTTIVSLRARHDEWVGLAVALLTIAVGFRANAARGSPATPWQQVFAGILALVLVFAWAKRRDFSNARLASDAAEGLPVNAAAFVLRQNFAGPLFNDFNWGGYLIWALPQLPVSMDGRTNVYGGVRTERSIATWRCLPGWNTDPDLNAANVVIGSVGAPLSSALEDDPQYRLVYQDAIAVVFIKSAH